MQKINQTIAKQKGAVLILMAFIIGLGALAYLLYAFDPARLRLEQDKKTMQTLNEAKQALIAWAVSHPNHPGIMPFPDRNDDLPQGYDDKSDCVTAGVAGVHLIGRLPLLSDINCVTPHVGLSIDGRDAAGEHLWYSVSINLVRMSDASAIPVINPSIVNSPSQPWFVVRDRSGAIISDRVAAVIISPGEPLPNQDRSGGVAGRTEYLDKIVMADNTPYQNYGYQDSVTNPSQEFIVGDDFRKVSKSDPTYKNQAIQAYYYNDKLVYITIDELMYALEKRVLEETKNKLNNYYSVNLYYPFAAGLGSTSNPNQCVQGNYRGLLPVNARMAHTCIYTAASRTSSCNFSVVSSVSFTRNAGSFVATGGGANSPTGACAVNPPTPRVCTCNGAGACKRSNGATQFSCDSCGNCTATVAGTNTFNTTGNIGASTSGCTNTPTQASCSGSNGTFTLSACSDLPIPIAPAVNGLPAWFLANQWQNYITYSVSSNCTSSGANCTTATPQLTTGSKSGVRAIVASPGAEIIMTPYAVSKASVQALRPSCDIKDYLDATENTNQVLANGLQDSLYQPTQTKGQSYNDQIVTVAP